jgi:hypothetical protein
MGEFYRRIRAPQCFFPARIFSLQNRIGEPGKIVFNVRALTETKK